MWAKSAKARRKEKTKQATHISDFHAHGSKSYVWPIRLARRRHQQLLKRHWGFWVQAHTEGVRTQLGRTSFNYKAWFTLSSGKTRLKLTLCLFIEFFPRRCAFVHFCRVPAMETLSSVSPLLRFRWLLVTVICRGSRLGCNGESMIEDIAVVSTDRIFTEILKP